MKRRFNKEKCVMSLAKVYGVSPTTYVRIMNSFAWINECDGLTSEEMRELGYMTDEDWEIEVEE